jgi:hypothetical protein
MVIIRNVKKNYSNNKAVINVKCISGVAYALAEGNYLRYAASLQQIICSRVDYCCPILNKIGICLQL